MDEKKLAKAQAILQEINKDFITYEDAYKLFGALQGAVQEAKKTLESLVSEGNKQAISTHQQALAKLTDFEGKVGNLIRKANEDTAKRVTDILTKEISAVKNSIPAIPAPFDPTELQHQIDVLMSYEAPKLEAVEARDALESLTGEERLDASAIKNLPESTKTIVEGMNKALAMHMLYDVDASGITTGQSLKWDGIRWIPYTPAGANTSVYNEVVSGSATTFTLANTPVSGTLRVYALGQRLLPTTDYSLSGAIITTVNSWSAGEITSDYEW